VRGRAGGWDPWATGVPGAPRAILEQPDPRAPKVQRGNKVPGVKLELKVLKALEVALVLPVTGVVEALAGTVAAVEHRARKVPGARLGRRVCKECKAGEARWGPRDVRASGVSVASADSLGNEDHRDRKGSVESKEFAGVREFKGREESKEFEGRQALLARLDRWDLVGVWEREGFAERQVPLANVVRLALVERLVLKGPLAHEAPRARLVPRARGVPLVLVGSKACEGR